MEKQEICPICHSEEFTDKVYCQQCRNAFCSRCVQNWKELKDQCPYKCSEHEWTVLREEDFATFQQRNAVASFRRVDKRKNGMILADESFQERNSVQIQRSSKRRNDMIPV